MKLALGTKSQSCWSCWNRRMCRTWSEVLCTFGRSAYSRELERSHWNSPAKEVTAWQDKSRMVPFRRIVLDGNSSCSDDSFPSFFQVCLLSWPALVSAGTPPWAPRSGWLQRLDSSFKTFCQWYSSCHILHFCSFSVFLPDYCTFQRILLFLLVKMCF